MNDIDRRFIAKALIMVVYFILLLKSGLAEALYLTILKMFGAEISVAIFFITIYMQFSLFALVLNKLL